LGETKTKNIWKTKTKNIRKFFWNYKKY